jgi:hypothetical protein
MLELCVLSSRFLLEDELSIDRKVRKLIREMSSANPLWGAPRVHGELRKLGIEISQLRWPSTWCEDEDTVSGPGAAFCSITLPALLRSICSLWHRSRFGCFT